MSIDNKEVIRKSALILAEKINKAVQDTAAELEDWVKDKLSTGQPPSQPGQFPHMDTGALRNSIKTRVTKDANEATITVSAGTAYAGYLEYGTSKMAARPFMRPSEDYGKRLLKQNLKEIR